MLPKGAVIIIETTAIVKIVLPQLKPNERGTPPIAAWTVAFGSWVKQQNTLSFLLNFVFMSDK